MISVDVTEQFKYSFSDLLLKFKSNEKETRLIIDKLKRHNILKTSSIFDEDISNLQNYNMELEHNGIDENYFFKYVGIIIISNFVIFCFPKYLHHDDYSGNKKHFKQVINVLKKYNSSKEQILRLQNDFDEDSTFNLLSIMIYLIEDYYENGIYSNEQKIIELNGSGEIFWDKTINEINPFIQNNIPYYVDFFNKKIQNDDSDYFKLLHEVILTKCSKDLEDAKLLDLFSLTPVHLNDVDLNDFGDLDYVKSKIIKEFNYQFNTRKKLLLSTMLNYLKKVNSYETDIDYFTFYGTTAYNLVWEEMCRCILNDKLKELLINLNLPIELKPEYKNHETLQSIIDEPKWNSEGINNMDLNKNLLIPDIITLNENEDIFEFIIFDAKYYDFPSKKPGIADITKQYLYELAFGQFCEEHRLIPKNCFIFPSIGDKIVNEDFVELNMLKNLGLCDIQAVLLPVDLVNKYYLNNALLDISELHL